MRKLVVGLVVLLVVLAMAAPVQAFECDGIPLRDGCLFTATGGDTPNRDDDGYAVTNAGGVPMWDFIRDKDLQALGYPISGRWVEGPFTLQAFQKVILQWDSANRQMNWYNTLDALANRYPQVALPNVPPHQVLPEDRGVTDFAVIVRNHLALLDANPKIKAEFLADPNWLNLYGLPIRYEEREVNGNPQGLQLLRAQRIVFEVWNVPAPGTSLGGVGRQNVPDKVKKLSNVIIPDAAKPPITADQAGGRAADGPAAGRDGANARHTDPDRSAGHHAEDHPGDCWRHSRTAHSFARADRLWHPGRIPSFRRRPPGGYREGCGSELGQAADSVGGS